MTNRTYDRLAVTQRLIIPALVTLILGLGELFSFEPSSTIASVVSMLNAFFGAVLRAFSSEYFEAEQKTAYLVEEADEEEEQEGGVG